MDLTTAISLRSDGRTIQAGGKPDRFKPVHYGAHSRFVKSGYMHTGNKMRGGIATSEYFKTKGGDSRNVSVQADGSFVKHSQTAKGHRRSRGKITADGMKKGAATESPKVDHLAEYKRLMKESGSHQRAADALADSHQDEDRPLYEQHAGKAWRLGNKAMDHFRRLTKEQRAMMKEDHWKNSQPQQGFGKKKKVAAGGPGSGRHPGGGAESKQFDVRKFKSGSDAYAAGHAHVLDQLQRIQGMMKNEYAPSNVKNAGWGHAGSVSDISKHLADIHNSLAGSGEYEHPWNS